MCTPQFVWDNCTNPLNFFVFVHFMCHQENTVCVPPIVFQSFLHLLSPSILCAFSPFLPEPQGILFIYFPFFGNQSCRNHTLPTLRHPKTHHPSPLLPTVCVFLSPDAHDVCGGEGGVRTECVRVCVFARACVCVHMEMCLAELVTENEQRSRRCWFVLQQGPPHLIRPQSQHTVWHDTNTAYGNETCIWLQLGAMWPSLHKSPALRRATFEGGL